MKQNRVSQKEKERILQMYGSKYLNEETTGNKTIKDIQKLVGVKDDNILEIGLNRAVDVIATAAEKKAAGGGRKGFARKKSSTGVKKKKK